MSDLKSFKKKGFNADAMRKEFGEQQIPNQKLAEDLIGRYQNQSPQALEQELLRVATEGRKNGTIDKGKLDEISQALLPLVDGAQKKRAQELINMLKRSL